jgi:hypothetical protein
VLVLLRLSVLPAGGAVPVGTPPAATGTAPAATGPAETPAAQPTPAAPTATPEQQAARFAVGAAVVVTEDGVRLRDEPSTGGGVVAGLEAGRELVVTGAPVEGDGILWYPVEAADDPAVAGYVAEEFLAAAE